MSFEFKPTRKVAILVSYIGTGFCGWQKQSKDHSGSAPSVGGLLEQALARVLGCSANVVGSGRTDAGVHALGQVAHFRVPLDCDRTPEQIFRGMNSLLPPAIRVLGARDVAQEFHAQRSATHKQYCYTIQQGPIDMPALEPLTWWVRKKLDLTAMQTALDFLVGEHDFKPFQARGSAVESTVRRILEAQVEPITLHSAPGGWGHAATPGIRIRLVGTGFLKQMVRGIVGTLVPIGEGRQKPDLMKFILKDQDRALLGQTAPSRGLWLERVWYPAQFGEFDILDRVGLETAPYATSSSDRKPK